MEIIKSQYLHLQDHQIQMIDILAKQGMSQSSIASELSISQSTVSRHVRKIHKNCSKVAEQVAMSDVFWALIETAKQRQMLQNLRWHSNRHIRNVLQISKTRLQQLYALEGLQKCMAVAKPYLSHPPHDTPEKVGSRAPTLDCR
jgi:predicted transcriptional regulator